MFKINRAYEIGLFVIILALNASFGWTASHFQLVSQSDWSKNVGFYIHLENDPGDDGISRLNSLKLVFAVGDGSGWRYLIDDSTPWSINTPYKVKADIEQGNASLRVNGKLISESKGSFALLDKQLSMNGILAWTNDPTDYIVLLDSVKIISAEDANVYLFRKESSRPLPVIMFAPQAPKTVDYKIKPGAAMSVEVCFKLVKYPDIHEYAPYIDKYGQCRYAEWPGKVKCDDDLKKAAVEETQKLKEYGIPADYDKYGGYLKAGWKETPTGFYNIKEHNGCWWLITPEGNPCFYIGLCAVPSFNWEPTPVAGREFLFEWLPPKTGLYADCWLKDVWGSKDGEYVALHTANMIKKYGEDWKQTELDLTAQRIKSWGFSGVGKWGGLSDMPIVPVLGAPGVPVLARHPDVFDPVVQEKFRESLEKQIEPRLKDPNVVGWSFGNEYGEIITSDEIKEILKKSAETPSKRALVDYAINNIYKSNKSEMGATWNVEDIYASSPNPPADDIEKLRRYYADQYYNFLYKTIKSLDPNHIYFGFWIVPGWWENEEDWRIIARHCDVIGYDLYSTDFADEKLMALSVETKKPIICGEFSFPSFYNGSRGFGTVYMLVGDDADAGDKYAKWIQAAAQNPYCVGAMWFLYRDQHLTGRGPGSGEKLVIGEHYAFGCVDITDTPKWQLVEKMRQANLSAAKLRAIEFDKKGRDVK